MTFALGCGVTSEMKRFLVFAGDDYYPRGGFGDAQESFDTLDEAICYGHEHAHPYSDGGFGWWHVVDMDSRSMVSEGQGFNRKNNLSFKGVYRLV